MPNSLPTTGRCTRPATPPPTGGRTWRPLLAAAFGLLSLADANAQHRLQPVFDLEKSVVRPLPAAAPVVQPVRTVVAHKVLAAISSTAAGGDWSAPATWVGGVVPTASDDVTIVAGATVTLDVAASAASLTIAATGSLLTSATTAYQLQVAGSVTNNGVLDLSNSATIGSDLRFTSAGSVTFSGSGTTDLQTISLAKSVRADVVDMNLPALSVKGSTTTGDGFLLTLTTGTTPVADMTGTLKVSGTAAISNKVFVTAGYIIPATGGFWLNNSNFTVAPQNASPSVSGLLRISAGTYSVGASIGNSITFGSGAVYTQEGGTMNVAGRFSNSGLAITFTMTAGTLNSMVIGSTSSNSSFGLFVTTGVAFADVIVNISGGTINLVNRNSAATPGLDYNVTGTPTITGGTLQIGTAATATNFNFRITGNTPSMVVDNTGTAKTVALAGTVFNYGTLLVKSGAGFTVGPNTYLQFGATLVNDGTFTANTAAVTTPASAASTVYFAGSVPQTLSGAGTFSAIRSLSIDNNGGGVTLNVPIVAFRVNMFTGNLNGTGNLTVGDGSATFFAIQIGVSGNTGTSGSFTAAPSFNIGVGALQLIYAPELTARTTGFEIPASRNVDVISIANPAGVILAGGNVLVNSRGASGSSLLFSSGLLTTSAANTVVIGLGATTTPAGIATSYVKGPLGITVNSPTAVSRTFAVGDAGGWRPVVVAGITAATDQTFTATVVAGATGGSGVSPVTNLNPTRYVRLQNTANLPATATVQLSYGADDVLGNAATAVVTQAPTAAGAYASIGGAAATTPTTGIVSTQSLTPGNDFFVLANTEGGTLASSVTAVCAGTNSGTLTLSGNVGTITGYQADAGSGFVTLAGTNTASTYTFANLTTTTTFRAVIMTSDNRTVYSAPVTVTVNPATTATFSYGSTAYCVSGTNPTPTVTGTAGGTFASTTGLVIDATTGAIALAGSTPGTYTVTYSVGGSCPSSATASVTITAAPVAAFSYANASYCTSAANPTPVVPATSTAGTFSSTTGLVIDATTGTISLATSMPGTYTVTNTVAAAGGCGQVTATTQVTINAATTATFSYGGSTFCQSGTNPTPTVTGTAGGAFASTTGLSLNATTGAINLTASTLGTYTVTYSVGGPCPSSATAQVTVTSAPVATFSYANAAYCAGGTNPAPVFATGASGGAFTSTTGLVINASTGVIDLTASTAGTYTVTNAIVASGGCAAASATATVTINALPTATLTASGPTTFCAGGSVTLSAPAGTGNTYQFLLNGTAIGGATGATYAATASGAYSVVVTSASGCSATSAATAITVNPATTATFSYSGSTYCVSGTNPTATVTGTAGGTFASTTGLVIDATTGTIALAGSMPGTYTVTYSVGGSCPSSATASVTITAALAATFSYATATGCVGSTGTATPTLGTGATAGAFSSTTGLTINATTGVITLGSSTAGTYTITNTVAAAGGCAAATATTTFTVNPRPATPTISAAYGPTSTTLTSSAATGNQFYFNGTAIANATGQTYVVSGTPASLGSYTVTTTNANGCVSLPSLALVVTSSLKPLAGSSLTVYPNPTHDGNLRVELKGYHQAVELTVLNALGQVVNTTLVPAATGTTTQVLNLSQLPSGIYIMRAKTEGGVDARRIVKD